MDDYQTTKISSNFVIHVTPYARGFTLSDHEKILVENIWNHEPNALYNGQILNFVSLQNETLVGEFVEYKYYVAGLRDEELRESMGIKAVSLSGITIAGEKVLMGQRSGEVTQYPHKYEMVPSGGIDPSTLVGDKIDLQRQFEIELWEESGISVTEIKAIRPFALVYDQVRKSYEVCAEIAVNYSVLKDYLEPSDEYQKLDWVSKSDVRKFVKQHKDEFVPFSLYLMTIGNIFKNFD